MIRSICGIFAGLFVALIGLIGVEGISTILHPFPPGFKASDFDACKAHVARYPATVLLLVVFLWGLTTFVSTWVATRVGNLKYCVPGIVVGIILLTGVTFNMAMLPYPNWFWVNLIVFPACIAWGAMLGRPDSVVS